MASVSCCCAATPADCLVLVGRVQEAPQLLVGACGRQAAALVEPRSYRSAICWEAARCRAGAEHSQKQRLAHGAGHIH